MKYFIPENLDIDFLFRLYPPTKIKRFKKEHLLYILHLITNIPSSTKKMLLSDYVPISSVLLQKKVRNYKSYIEYLLENKVLLTDNQYKRGKKSIGYRFAPNYRSKLKQVSLDNEKSGKGGRSKCISPAIQKKYNHLLKWYNPELKINKQLAMEYIEQDLQNNLTLLKQSGSGSGASAKNRVDPFRQYTTAQIAIEKISAASFFPHIDTTVSRLHSVITNLRSDLRNFLTYNGLELVSIDIVNSQPYLSTLLLSSHFFTTSQVHSLQPAPLSNETVAPSPECTLCSSLLHFTDISRYSSIYKIFNSYSSLSSFIMLCKSAEICIQSDLQKYKNLVKEGTFYQYMEKMFSKKKKHSSDRKKIKAAVFQILFTDNRFFGQTAALPKRIFKEAFPTVYRLFAMIKQKDKRNLPILLQRIESHLVLQVITKRIADKRPGLPLLTIHDSIITTKGNEEYVKEIIIEEMTKAVGFAPKLKTEYWNLGNLKHNKTIVMDKRYKVA